MNRLDKLKKKAFALGATEFGVSQTKTKKFYVVYNNNRINFGQKNYSDFTLHKDDDRRQRFLARHTKIRIKMANTFIN